MNLRHNADLGGVTAAKLFGKGFAWLTSTS